MRVEKVYFSATDDIQLFGMLHTSEIKTRKVILSVHGMTSNCFKKREDIFAQEFTKNGIDYFCFNNRGSDIITYYEKIKDGKLVGRIEAGSALEIFEDCYHTCWIRSDDWGGTKFGVICTYRDYERFVHKVEEHYPGLCVFDCKENLFRAKRFVIEF